MKYLYQRQVELESNQILQKIQNQKLLHVAPTQFTPSGFRVSTDWKTNRDYFLGAGLSQLMQFCEMGRDANSHNVSVLSYQQRIKEDLEKKGITMVNWNELLVGQLAAMSQVCPMVR